MARFAAVFVDASRGQCYRVDGVNVVMLAYALGDVAAIFVLVETRRRRSWCEGDGFRFEVGRCLRFVYPVFINCNKVCGVFLSDVWREDVFLAA